MVDYVRAYLNRDDRYRIYHSYFKGYGIEVLIRTITYDELDEFIRLDSNQGDYDNETSPN